MHAIRFIALAMLVSASGHAAFAGDLDPLRTESTPMVQSSPLASPNLIFTLRGGVASAPDYFGSGDYSLGPDFGFRLGYLSLPGGRSFGNLDGLSPDGFGLRGSFRYIDQRDDADNSELAGLDDIDSSVELGLGVGYTSRKFDAFADVRYGVIGHESFVGELGADLKAHPSDRLSLSLGPRLLVGSEDYASTYFGVTPAESVASGGSFAPYAAGGGAVSAGVELGMTYQISDNWGLEGAVAYDRFVGDAEDSPIVHQGERDQYGVRIGITRRIVLDF